MTYPYHSGQAQEDLSDCLVPASLYGLKVTHPGYCSADTRPAPSKEAQAAFDRGRGFVDHVCDTDVNPLRSSWSHLLWLLGGQRARPSIRLWWHAADPTRRLSAERARAGSVALQPPRLGQEPDQSQTLKLSLSQQTNGLGSVALLTWLLLLLLARQRHLVQRRAKAAGAQPG